MLSVLNMNSNQNIGMWRIASNRPTNNGNVPHQNNNHSTIQPFCQQHKNKGGALKGQRSMTGNKKGNRKSSNCLSDIKMTLKYRYVVQLSPTLIRCEIKLTNIIMTMTIMPIIICSMENARFPHSSKKA